MDPTRENFLILYGIIVTLVVISFLMIRKAPRPPVKLNLGKRAGGEPEKPAQNHEYAPNIQGSPPYTPRKLNSPYAVVTEDTDSGARQEDTAPGSAPQSDEKSLNVLFNWNGHTWDAYEVLGVPAGSSQASARAAFQRALAQSETESAVFLMAALDAIERSYSS